MREITLQEMRELQLAMLDRIHEFCTERGMRYSLGGGTLLGAVRHKGYIPWDDDIDIMLPRPDYERFLTEFEGRYEHLNIQSYRTDKAYPKLYAKIYDNRTVLTEGKLRNGIFIDVFPIDGVPQDVEGYWRRKSNYERLVKIVFLYPNKEFRYRFAYSLFRHFLPSREKLISQIESFTQTYDVFSSPNAGSVFGAYGKSEVMSADVFKTLQDIQFEDRSYKAITMFDAYLTQHYGNYMELPPVEERVPGHNFVAYWK